MQTRRLIAAGVVVVIVIAMALLIKNCEGSATTDSLKSYNASVYQLVKESTGNAQKVLNQDLTGGNLTGISTQLGDAVQTAIHDVAKTKALSVPSQMAAAQSSLLTVMNLREQGLSLIAQNAQAAASKGTSKDAVYQISLGTSQLYASDVIYKTTVTLDLARALNANNIPIGTGINQQQIYSGQVIPDLGWLDRTWIADKIHAQQSTAAANANNNQPGLHGHSIGPVTVGGVTLQAGITNRIKASDARNWVLSVSNGGDFNEFSVSCSVQIVAQSDAGTGTIPETIAHQTANCPVTLQSTPQTGPYQVIVKVAKVPRETNVTNNTATYDVVFY